MLANPAIPSGHGFAEMDHDNDSDGSLTGSDGIAVENRGSSPLPVATSSQGTQPGLFQFAAPNGSPSTTQAGSAFSSAGHKQHSTSSSSSSSGKKKPAAKPSLTSRRKIKWNVEPYLSKMKKAIAVALSGRSTSKVAAQFGIPARTLRRYVANERVGIFPENGSGDEMSPPTSGRSSPVHGSGRDECLSPVSPDIDQMAAHNRDSDHAPRQQRQQQAPSQQPQQQRHRQHAQQQHQSLQELHPPPGTMHAMHGHPHGPPRMLPQHHHGHHFYNPHHPSPGQAVFDPTATTPLQVQKFHPAAVHHMAAVQPRVGATAKKLFVKDEYQHTPGQQAFYQSPEQPAPLSLHSYLQSPYANSGHPSPEQVPTPHSANGRPRSQSSVSSFALLLQACQQRDSLPPGSQQSPQPQSQRSPTLYRHPQYPPQPPRTVGNSSHCCPHCSCHNHHSPAQSAVGSAPKPNSGSSQASTKEPVNISQLQEVANSAGMGEIAEDLKAGGPQLQTLFRNRSGSLDLLYQAIPAHLRRERTFTT